MDDAPLVVWFSRLPTESRPTKATSRSHGRLMRQLERIRELPPTQQRTVLDVLNSLLEATRTQRRLTVGDNVDRDAAGSDVDETTGGAVFDQLSVDAKQKDEFEYVCALLRIRGIEDPGWDRLRKPTRSFVHDDTRPMTTKELCESRRKHIQFLMVTTAPAWAPGR